MSDPAIPPLAGPTPALRSITLKGALAMLIAFVGQKLGADLAPGAVEQAAAAISDLVFVVGLMLVSVGRARARGPLV